MVFPVSDVNPTRRRPVVTLLFIAANVAVFLLLTQDLQGCDAGRFLFRYAAIPRELLSLDQLDRELVEALLAPCDVARYDKSVPVSAISAMFLHANLAHLAGNMLFLWVFGNNVEDRLGRIRFAVFYLGGGLVATYAFALLHADTVEPLLGASGAVAAVLGAYIVAFPHARVTAIVPFPFYLLVGLVPGAHIRAWFFVFAVVAIPAWFALGMWFVLQLLSTGQADTGVAFEAHIAGFVAGAVVAFAMRARTTAPPDPWRSPPPALG